MSVQEGWSCGVSSCWLGFNVRRTFSLMNNQAIGVITLIFSALTLHGQITTLLSRSPHVVVERGPHHRVWQSVMSELGPLGETMWSTNSYVELQTGACYQENGQWVDASDEIEIFPEGAVARHTQHKVVFASNLNSVGAIDLLTPDGKRMRSTPVGLAYYDAASGQSVWIAGVKDCRGSVLGANQVIYANAFSNIVATVRYTVSKAGFEQDIILQEQPPAPEEFGLASDTTRLEVVTEFYESPVPDKTAAVIKHYTQRLGQRALVDPVFLDEELDFGAMRTGRGRAFKLTDEDDPNQGVEVGKHFGNSNGRTFMIEGVDYQAIRQQFSQLPETKKAIRTAMSPSPTQSRSYPPLNQAAKTKSPLLMTQSGLRFDAGVVIDYSLVVNANNMTFRGDTTYYVLGTVSLTGTSILEGGCVIKYASTGSLTFTGTVKTDTSAYHPVIMTSKDDNSVGEAITGSTGNPSGYYGTGLVINSDSDLQYLYCKYLNIGVSYAANHINTISHSKFSLVATAFRFAGGTNYLRNMLFDNASSCLNFVSGSTVCSVEHATANAISTSFATGQPATLNVTNSLFAQGGLNTFQFISDHCATNSTTNGVFQMVGAGASYLADNTYRNQGTTNINQSLLAALRKETTYPPVILSGVVSIDTVLSPQAQRDTDVLDLGYHYDPMDYLSCGLAVMNATVTMTNGVAVGVYGASGFDLRSGGVLVSEGRPGNPNRLARIQSIQERTNNYNGQTFTGLITVTANYTTLPKILLRLTDLSMVAGPVMDFVNVSNYMPYERFSLTDCTLRGGRFYLSSWNETRYSYTALTNSLFERCNLNFEQPYGGGSYNYPFGLTSYNCNYKNSTVNFHNAYAALPWNIYDNLFDTVTMGSVTNIINGNNAYLATTQLASGVSNVVLSSFNYATGTFGTSYQSSTNLINKGSRIATAASLYHYTILTNNVKETNTVVDIGYHYVAVDGSTGKPYDQDGDGMPDYLEDRNGNGNGNDDATSWTNYNSLNGLGGTVGLKVYTPLK